MTKRTMKKQVYNELVKTLFPTSKSRKNISDKSIYGFCLGTVNYRGQKSVGYKTMGPSKYNKQFPILLNLLVDMMDKCDPEFEYTTIQINKNFSSTPHVDKNNVGPSYVIAMGNYTQGGNIYVEGKKHDINNKLLLFDGRLGHWVSPYKGIRYSIVFFTHTFKPPCPSTRNIRVSTLGLWDKCRKTKKIVKIKTYTSSGAIVNIIEY